MVVPAMCNSIQPWQNFQFEGFKKTKKLFTSCVWTLLGPSKVATAKQLLCEEQRLNYKQVEKNPKQQKTNAFLRQDVYFLLEIKKNHC